VREILIDKKFRRKVLTYANSSAYLITIPKEVKEAMALDATHIVEMEFDDSERLITARLKKESSGKEDVVERKVMSINEQLAFTVPAKKAKELDIDEDTIVELDGDVASKILVVHVNGKDMSELDEVLENG